MKSWTIFMIALSIAAAVNVQLGLGFANAFFLGIAMGLAYIAGCYAQR